MIITCPSCSFEQPLESEYCPSCGGHLKSLLKKEKTKKRIEHFRTKVVLFSLSLILLAGYALTFLMSTKKASQATSTEISKTTGVEFLKLKSGKIKGKVTKKTSYKTSNKDLSEDSTPEVPSNQEVSQVDIEPSQDKMKLKSIIKEASFSEDSAPSEDSFKKTDLKDNDAVTAKSPEKSVVKVELRDSLNCTDLNQIALVSLNEEESQAFINCSQQILTNIETKKNYILEETDESLISFSIHIEDNEFETTINTLIDEEEFNLKQTIRAPNIKEDTHSFIALIKPDSSSENTEGLIRKSDLLPLIFTTQGADEQSFMTLHITYSP